VPDDTNSIKELTMKLLFLLILSLSSFSVIGTFSIFSMQEAQQDVKSPKKLLQICLDVVKVHKKSLQPKIDDFTSKTIASVISNYYINKQLTNFEYLDLEELCRDDDVSTDSDVIKSVQESNQARNIRGKIQFFEKIPNLSVKTQRKIMGTNQLSGASIILTT